MRPPAPLPPDLQGQPFPVTARGAPGVTPKRARAADLAAPFRGVRASAALPLDAGGLARAFAPLLAPDQCFSHRTAMALHGMRDAPASTPVIDVMSFGGRRPVRRRGVAGHRGGPSCRRSIVDGLPVLDPVETWLHMAATASADELVVIGDGLVGGPHPRRTIAALREAFAAHRRLVGAPRLALALELIRPRTDSARETELRLLLARAGVPEAETNGAIRNEYGAVIAHGDLLWREQRVIVEYDGDQHRSDRRQFAVDIDRIGAIQALGWRVLRVDASLFARPRTLLQRLAAALEGSP